MRRLVFDLLQYEEGKAYGFQDYVFNFLRFLAKHIDELNYDTIVLACLESQKSYLEVFSPKFDVIGFHCSSAIGRLYTQTMLPYYLKLNMDDLLFAPGNYTGLIKHSRVLLTIHDLLFKRKHLMPSLVFRCQRELYVPFSIKNADLVVGISKFTRQDIISYYPWAENKTKWIYNFLDAEKFSGGMESELKGYFLSVCSNAYHKNTITVIKAYSEYCEGGGSRGLVFVGGANENSEIGQAIGSLRKDVKDRIVIKSHISTNDLSTLYKNADAYISASLFEGLGMPIVEAMLFNLPVLITDDEVFREVSINKGLYFDPYDYHSLSNLMLNTSFTKQSYSEDIREMFSEEHTFAVYLKEINRIYSM